MPASNPVPCRWDWCRSSFPSVGALDAHVKHEHIWPMKPMRKADIALMRRMDLQSLHSSPDTDSSIIPRGRVAGVSRNKTPPQAVPLTSTPKEDDAFDTFTQLSSPPQVRSPQRLPASPALESLMRQNGHSGLSAAVEMFERAYAPKANHRIRLSSPQRSPTHRPLSESSGSSQEVVEQQLTQEDDAVSPPQPPLPSESQIENDLVDAELIWPPGDESDVIATEGAQDTAQPASKQNHRRDTSSDPARGQSFRYGSLNVPLNINGNSADPSHPSQGAHSQSQPIILQTQAPYSSQHTGWSQTE